MDLIYGPEPTPFLKAAEEFGVRTTDGCDMLVQQGAVAFERWWGKEPDIEAMTRALNEAIGR